MYFKLKKFIPTWSLVVLYPYIKIHRASSSCRHSIACSCVKENGSSDAYRNLPLFIPSFPGAAQRAGTAGKVE